MSKVEILSASDHPLFTPEAKEFLVQLHLNFTPYVRALLEARQIIQRLIDSGIMPTFLAETRDIREMDWNVVEAPEDLQRRTVEITGPPVRKMVINALNSGANVFMADFEDSHCPTWDATLEGQVNLYDANRRQIDFEVGERSYILKEEEDTATLMVRPRGWHLNEKHFLVEGEAIPAGLFDFGLYFFHNAQQLLSNGSGPYFYLPKLESHTEARLWAEIFEFAEEWVGVPKSSIRATVLIETITAAFEMEEILYELKNYSAGLNCGRWDYIFSFIKKFRNNPHFTLPDRAQVTMTSPCMQAYCELLIQTCHKRGAFAMGGMAAQIPIRGDDAANTIAMNKVEADKKREAYAGHDGTWVAHPGLIGIAREAFVDLYGNMENQLHIKRDVSTPIGAKDLLEVPRGTITREGVDMNVRVGLLYVDAWLRGNGCVALYNLMEDAATAEISRAQLWQWIKNDAQTEDGELVSSVYVKALDSAIKEFDLLDITIELFDNLILDEQFVEFLTLPAYDLLELEGKSND